MTDHRPPSATGGADVETLPASTSRQVDLPDIRRRWKRLRQLPFDHSPSTSSEDAERRNIEFVLVQDDVPWLVNQVAALARRAERAEAALRWAIDNHDCGGDPFSLEPCTFCSTIHEPIAAPPEAPE